MNKAFDAIKAKAIDAVFGKQGFNPQASIDTWLMGKVDKIKALNDFPVDNVALKNVPVRAKIIILRAELKAKFPGVKFAVVKDGYNSIRVTIKSPVDAEAVKILGAKYSNPGNTDLMTDYFDYDNYVFVGEDIEIDTGVAKIKAFGLTGSPVVIL